MGILQIVFILCSNCSFRVFHNYGSTIGTARRKQIEARYYGFICLSLEAIRSPSFSHMNLSDFKLAEKDTGKCKGALKCVVSTCGSTITWPSGTQQVFTPIPSRSQQFFHKAVGKKSVCSHCIQIIFYTAIETKQLIRKFNCKRIWKYQEPLNISEANS